MPTQTGYFDTLKSIAGKVFTYLASITLTGTDGKIITVTQDTTLDEAVAMSSKLTIPGAWTTPVFDAGDFTAGGLQTWTVEAGDVSTYAYTILGKIMILSWSILTTTVAGTPDATLLIKIPASKTPTKTMVAAMKYIDNGAASAMGSVIAIAGVTNLYLRKIGDATWTASTNLTTVSGQIIFEIN